MNTSVNTCSLCKAEESDICILYECESCKKKVCAHCSPYKSPIPFIGKTNRCRICKSCVLCYSNCLPIFYKNYTYNPSSVDMNLYSYATFAESKCCRDIYNHCLHPSEKMNDFGQSFKDVGDYEITPLWVPDSMSLFCSNCKSNFSLFHRRHHCRVCGRVFCKKCASSKTNLTKYGYPIDKMGPQRVCDTCLEHITSKQSQLSKLPYNIRVTICSFLNPSSVLNLSAVNRATHRCCTSRDFDQTYWKYMALGHNTSFSDVLKPEKHIRLAKDPLMHNHHQASECHWSICTINQNKELEERGILSCTDGCHWRFEYIQKYAIPGSLHASLFFIKYPIISLRTCALRQLRQESIQEALIVQEAVNRKEIMASLIHCIQFGNNEVLRQKGITKEILDLLLMTTACLLNTTQSSRSISKVFRENEGITTLVAILQNDYINPRTSLLQSPDSPVIARLTDSFNSPSVPTEFIPPRDSSVKKICLYTVGILMNLCNVDGENCIELANLNAIPLLASMIQLTNEKHILYCLECIKACCKQSLVSKNQIGKCDGIIRIINCYSCPNAQVVSSAVNTTAVVLAHHVENTRLFRLANGLNGLMQIEESWQGKCSVAAAKAISNILHNDSKMVEEFLHQRGLQRMQLLFRQHRIELSGLLFGQLMNCGLFSQAPLYIQAPLLSAFLQEIEKYIDIIVKCEIQPVDLIMENNSQASFDRHPTLSDGYQHMRSEHTSSLSDNSSDFSSLTRSLTENEDRKKISSYVLNHVCFWLGFAAGSIRYLLKNIDNAQLFIDFDIEGMLNRMFPHCDHQGKLFINEALSLIDQYCEEGTCTRQSVSKNSLYEDTYSEGNERLSDLTKSSEWYSPRF